MNFVKFYLSFIVGLNLFDLINFFILDMKFTPLIGLLGIIAIILTTIAIFKFRKQNLSRIVKLFPILLFLSVITIIVLMSIYAGASYELAQNGSGVKEAVSSTPYWILLLDKFISFIFMVYAICILRSLKKS